jgi:hypothetical protein
MAQLDAAVVFEVVDRSAKAWLLRANDFRHPQCHMPCHHLSLCVGLWGEC